MHLRKTCCLPHTYSEARAGAEEFHTAYCAGRFVPSSLPRESKRDLKNLYQLCEAAYAPPRARRGWSTVGRNVTVAGEWTLAGALRWLAGGDIYEVIDGPRIIRSTVYVCEGSPHV